LISKVFILVKIRKSKIEMDVAYLLLKTQEKFNKKNSWFSWNRLGYAMIIPILQILSLFRFWKAQDQKKLAKDPIVRLYIKYRCKFMLLKNGNVVWGHLVQGNSGLFQPGKEDLYASLVYSPTLLTNDNLPELARIAWELYELKDKKIEHPEVIDLKPIAAAITYEYRRPLLMKVPDSIAKNQSVYFASVLVYRKHLPKGNLQSNWFPLLVAPHLSKEIMILPSQYWHQNLLEAWTKKAD